MRRRLKIALIALPLAGLASCGVLLTRAYEQGTALDRDSRERGCQRANKPLVLLGGGMASPEQLSKRSLARVRGTLDFLAKERRPGAHDTLITSGGPVASPTGQTEAGLMRQAIDRARPGIGLEFIEEGRSLTTRENARYVGELMDARKLPKDVILLTEVFHLARAARDFEREGFVVCPVSVAGPSTP